MWMIAGFAGGIQPWWHHVGAYHEDRRMYRTAEPVMRWCKANERYLVNRTPVASVGVDLVAANTDFFGRDEAARAGRRALYRLHARPRPGARFRTCRCTSTTSSGEAGRPDGAHPARTSARCRTRRRRAIRRFVERGGSLIATGHDQPLRRMGRSAAGLRAGRSLRVSLRGRGAADAKRGGSARRFDRGACSRRAASGHTYLRLSSRTARARRRSEVRATSRPSPASATRYCAASTRRTSSPTAARLMPLRWTPGAMVPLDVRPAVSHLSARDRPGCASRRRTFPGLILSRARPGRASPTCRPTSIAATPANTCPITRACWPTSCAGQPATAIPLTVEGTGFIDCHLYEQPGRMILHLVNLTSEATWRAPFDELIRVGPFRITMPLPPRVATPRARLLVAETTRPVAVSGGKASLEISSILDHEVVVLE